MNADRVAQIVATQLPALAGLEVVPLGAGTDHWAFEVGGRWVLRFPRSDEAAAALAREARLTRLVAPALPLAVPLHELLGAPSPGFPRPFAGYAKLPGTPALHLPLAALRLEATGAALGAFLRALHAIDVAAVAALGLPVEPAERLEEWSSEALADLRRCRAAGHVLSARWERVLATPPVVREVAPRLVHADLAAEHVLVGEDGLPCAVIDWTDACLGDPARDLAGLVHWGGAALLAAALPTYGAVDAATLDRARWLAACRGVADVAFGEAEGRPEYVAGGLRALAAVASLVGA